VSGHEQAVISGAAASASTRSCSIQRLLDTHHRSAPEPWCVAATFGVVDGRVEAAPSWLCDQQLDDGGWNGETIRSGSRHGSFHSTIAALEALQAWTLGVDTTARVVDAASRGREFFAVHRLYRSHRTGEVVDPRFTRMVSSSPVGPAASTPCEHYASWGGGEPTGTSM
jgi:hypothetical protein